jgi:hypothetical protein
MTQSMVYTLIGAVGERQHFSITTLGAVTSESHTAIGFQTGFGAAWMTPWPGVSAFGQVVENFYGQHTFDGGPASPGFIYKMSGNETVATAGIMINANRFPFFTSPPPP